MFTIDKQMNRVYSPSCWSKRLSENEIVEQHISFINSVSESTKNEVPNFTDINYGKKTSTLMDIYGTDLEKGAPIFVYIHGGYWQMLSKNDSNYVVKHLWKSKIKVFVPDYDLAPKVTLEEIVNDIRDMAIYVLQLGVKNNSSGIWFGGHSAGAHLAASLLDEQWLSSLPTCCKSVFKGLILISGIYDLLPLLKTEYNEALHLNSARAISLSPLHNVQVSIQKCLLNEEFKVLISVAQYDSPAFVKQSYLFYKKLKEINVKVQFLFLTGMDHYSIVEQLQNESYDLTQAIISLITNGEWQEESVLVI